MVPAGDAYDGRHHAPGDQLRHDLLTPVTVASARLGMLRRQLARSPGLDGPERDGMLATVAAVEAALQSLCAVVDGLGGRAGDPPA
jgi:hypothetical protein